MKTNHYHLPAAAILAFALLTLSSWKSENSALPVKRFMLMNQEDTTVHRKKEKKEYKTAELDQAMKDLDKAMAEMNHNINIDQAKMDKEIKAAMEEVKKIDFDRIGHEVAAELKKVDWSKIKEEIRNAMQDAEKEMNEATADHAELAKVKEEIRDALHKASKEMKEVDMKKVEKEIAKAKEELSKEKILAHVDMEKIKKSIDKGMAEAKLGIEKAKKEIALMKEFTETLEKDGLINRKKGYKIEIKEGELYLNGNKQSKETSDKYRRYYKDENYSINSDGDKDE